jgi:protein-disulfide isomerase
MSSRQAKPIKAKRVGTARRPQPKPLLGREAKILLLIGLPIVLLFAVLAVRNAGGDEAPAVSAEQQRLLVREDSPALGPADAPVTIVEFLDPECESCRAAAPIVKRLLGEYDGRVRLVVRYFPLHNNSVLAATATEAAGEQGKYWEMQELLFTNQPQWGEKSTPQTALFIEYARGLGLNVEQFTAVLQGTKYAAKIERDRQDARTLGARGTPTFFINGRAVDDISYAGLKRAIDEALER